MTPLDRAQAAMAAAPEDARARLAFYDRLAETELYLLLSKEPDGAHFEPAEFDIEDGRFVLVFDDEVRLSDFVGRTAPYLAASGRALARMLRGRGLGLGLNFGAPSEIVVPADAVDWLAGMLEAGPNEVSARIRSARGPDDVPEALLAALDAKLAGTTGLARRAWLTGVTLEDGAPGHLLVFEDALPEAQIAIAQHVGEAVVLSGLDAGWLDVAFLSGGSPALDRIARVGLRIDLPQRAPTGPGRDPDRPPRLR